MVILIISRYTGAGGHMTVAGGHMICPSGHMTGPGGYPFYIQVY